MFFRCLASLAAAEAAVRFIGRECFDTLRGKLAGVAELDWTGLFGTGAGRAFSRDLCFAVWPLARMLPMLILRDILSMSSWMLRTWKAFVLLRRRLLT